MADRPASKGRGAALKNLLSDLLKKHQDGQLFDVDPPEEKVPPKARRRAAMLQKLQELKEEEAKVGVAKEGESCPVVAQQPAKAPERAVEAVTRTADELSIAESTSSSTHHYKGSAGRPVANYIKLYVEEDKRLDEYEVRFRPAVGAKSFRLSRGGSTGGPGGAQASPNNTSFSFTELNPKPPPTPRPPTHNKMDMEPKSLINDDPNVTLTIRLIMQGKEVGSIIGKKGEIVKRFREESGAKINISDGSCPERIVTVTGSTNAIFKAFTLICKKFEEWCSQFQDINSGGSGVPRPPITLRLIVPASQCGSLIGKGGSKIKEIREVTGASIQVASEMLPNSTERAVTISGTGEAITQCIYHICNVMLESPPKGATIPYRPKPQVGGPVILAGGQAYTIQGNYAVPAHTDMSALGKSPLAGLAALGLGGLAPSNTGGLNPAALAALAGSQLRTSNSRNQQNSNQQTHEMTVPNELIGCIIGKGGTKIAEIRQISGAMIRISNCDDRESGVTDRTITISGNPDAVALAQYLINMSVELQKANLEAQNSPSTGGSSQSSTAASPLASAIPLAQLLAKPGALNALTSLSALGGLTELLGGQAGAPPVQTTGVHRTHKSYTPRLRSPGSGGGPSEGSKLKSERNKFNPY